MILARKGSLEDELVVQLAREPGLTVRELHRRVQRGGRSARYSLKAVYKELKKLCDLEVLIRYRGELRIHQKWLEEVRSLSAMADAAHMVLPQTSRELILGRWSFRDLGALNSFWDDLLLQLIRTSEVRHICSFNPHPWWMLIQEGESRHFYRILKRKGICMYKICSSDTYLDRWAGEEYRKQGVHVGFAKSPLQGERKYLNVLGDYLVEIRLGVRAERKLHELSENVQRWSDLTHRQLFGALRESVASTITLRSHPRQAQKLRRMFGRYFGASV